MERRIFFFGLVSHWFFRSLVSFLATFSVVFSAGFIPNAYAHIENGTLTDSFRITSVTIVSKGPYEPGDVIAFAVVSDLPAAQRQWIQVTAECLAYPAEWHQATEEKFVVRKFAGKGQATAVISSGCLSGVHQVTEVMLSDVGNNYTRVTSEETTLPSFTVAKGHLQVQSAGTRLKRDALKRIRIPAQFKIDPRSEQSAILTLPRTTDGGQTLDWVATGECGIRRLTGASDLGGVLWASGQGLCVLAFNTPWGSNIYQPLNQAATIEVFPASALSCQSRSNRTVRLVIGSRCPKGYKKAK